MYSGEYYSFINHIIQWGKNDVVRELILLIQNVNVKEEFME